MGEIIEELLAVAEELESDKRDRLTEICVKLEQLEDADAILNLRNFKRELKRQGLMTEKLNESIENYIKFDNEI